jgi:hypothetical protein
VIKSAKQLRGIPFLVSAALVSAQCFAGSLTITISNGTTRNLYVTLYDMTTHPPLKILSSSLINGNASITVSTSPDASGQGNVAWTATTADRDMRACGHGDKSSLNSGDSLEVNVDSECSEQ